MTKVEANKLIKNFIGVDIGGMTVKGIIINGDGQILAEDVIETGEHDGGKTLVNNIVEMVNRMIYKNGGIKSKYAGIGIGCPGLIDSKRGTVVFSGNLELSYFPLAQAVFDAIGMPVKMVNDANAAALGEAKFGAGKKFSDSVLVTLGTGIGGGVVIDGTLYEGFKSAGTELGHMVIVEGGLPCTCGRCGCFEAYASASALMRKTREVMDENPDSAMWKTYSLNTVNGKTPFEYMDSDVSAKSVVDWYVKVASDYFGGGTKYALAQGCKGIKVGEIEFDSDGDGTDGVTVLNGDYFIFIKDGEFTVNATDDAFHSNSGDLIIDGGTYKVNTYDDAFTADKLLKINGGAIIAESCYEGLEGAYVEINGGTISVVSSDDGINAASDDNAVREYIKITGGDVTVKSGGDGIDSNGTINISGGTVTVYGATSGYDGGLDADGVITVDGGTVFATTVGMVETPANSSKQYVLSYYGSSKVSAGSVVKLVDASGTEIIVRTLQNDCQSIIISEASIAMNGVYKLYANDNELCTFTVTSIVTSIGNSGGGFPGGPGGPGGGFPGGPRGGFPG